MLQVFNNTRLLLLLSIITISFLAGCNAPDGNIEDGKRWYAMYNCASCHGQNANDGRAAAIASTDRSFGSFVRFLRNPDSPSMPSFPESKLSEEDAADIYSWLKSQPE